MINFSGKIGRENQNTFLIFFFENPAVYEIKWEDTGRSGQATDDNIIRRISFAC
jgi:hypothetical protein